MTKTFNINSTGNLEISTKVWSDFAATIPLIRSFSFGSNFPPEYPIFAGPPIRYHFGFFYLVGFLEKAGLPLDIALNSLSILAFFSLLIVIYYLGKTVFERKSVGVLSVFLFLFNGSLSFIEYFKNNPPSLNTFSQIVHNNTFSSFGPYDGNIVSAFWSLNIFTNQRHLALAYASFLALILLIYSLANTSKKITIIQALLIGIFIGIFPLVHLAVFGMIGIALLVFFIIYPKLRIYILVAGVTALAIAIPLILSMGSSQVSTSFFRPGYLVEQLTLANFTQFWFYNLGFVLILAPIGFLLSSKKQRKLFIPFIVLFVVGNLFQFSTEIAANHKFFNVFVIGANFYVAFLIVRLWKKRIAGKIASILLLFLLTLSGIIDLFPILNDTRLEIKDYPNDPSVSFILENTPKDSVFLNSSFLYDPASIAGRKIYLGWPYFSWSAGYDTSKRHNLMNDMFSSSDKDSACSALLSENIDYLEIINPTELEGVSINYNFFDQNFEKICFIPRTKYSIYDVNLSCV